MGEVSGEEEEDGLYRRTEGKKRERDDYLRAGLDDLIAEDVRVRGILLVVTPLRAAVVDELPVVLVLLGVEDKVAASAWIMIRT